MTGQNCTPKNKNYNMCVMSAAQLHCGVVEFYKFVSKFQNILDTNYRMAKTEQLQTCLHTLKEYAFRKKLLANKLTV